MRSRLGTSGRRTAGTAGIVLGSALAAWPDGPLLAGLFGVFAVLVLVVPTVFVAHSAHPGAVAAVGAMLVLGAPVYVLVGPLHTPDDSSLGTTVGALAGMFSVLVGLTMLVRFGAGLLSERRAARRRPEPSQR